MANSNGWGDGAANNAIGWGQGANNAIGWGDIHADSWAGLTDISGLPTTDPDAQAFITAASITDPTQQSAINQLVVDLKGYSIWTKFDALWPMVGGTATKHSYNLKNTAQYQIGWNGGVTHSNLGVQFGGVNGWGNTGYNLSTNASLNSHSISVYSRTTGTSSFQCELGVTGGVFDGGGGIFLRASGLTYYRVNSQASYITYSDADSRGFYLANRTASNVVNGWRNSTKVVTGTTVSYTPLANFNYSIGAFNENGGNNYYSAKQIAFASIGQGLTDTEAANFYTAVQAFQTTLGRSIGTQTVSDADAQAFVTNAGIVDQVEANAINNLVIGLKADSLWTKMKAVYPFVGGSSTSNSYNLVNTAQYQLSFSGGATHNSNGYTGGVNGYANTGLNPNTAFITNDSFHMSIYSRTNSGLDGADLGGVNGSTRTDLWLKAADGNCYNRVHLNGITAANTNSTGIYISTRNSSTSLKLFKNATQLGSTYTGANGSRLDVNMFLGAYNLGGTPNYYTQRNYAFASIGDGLSDSESTNLNSRINTFNTTLSR